MKKIVSVILTVAVMCTTCASAANFNDINGHWAETIINELADKGIVSGFGRRGLRYKPDIYCCE